jgi:hypothetical protein
MSIIIQRRRGGTADHGVFTGMEGEITIDTEKKTAIVHDGTKAGGYPLAREDLSNIDSSQLDGFGFARNDLSNVADDNPLTGNLAKNDLSNVTVSILADKGLAKSDLSNVNEEALKSALDISAKGYIYGYKIKNSITDTSHDIEIGLGSCRDESDTLFIKTNTPLVKKIDANWIKGSEVGGFPSSITLSVNSWYHVFVIYNPDTGEVDGGFDDDINATNLLNVASAAGFTKYRRIGSIKTDSNLNIKPFMQRGDYFHIPQFVELQITSNFPVNRTALTLSAVPTGVRVRPIVSVFTDLTPSSNSYVNIRFWDHEITSDAFFRMYQAYPEEQALEIGSELPIYTDTDQRVKWSVGNIISGSVTLMSQGYVDHRGRVQI